MKQTRTSLKRFTPLLYAILDKDFLGHRPLKEAALKVAAGGATMVQLREPKAGLARDFTADARSVKRALKKYPGVKFIVNDRTDVCLAADADGVHLGQSDLPVTCARTILGRKKIIGVSVESVSQARQAIRQSADYLGVGAIFTTPTKPDARRAGLAMLNRIKRISTVPVVAIGGIDARNAGRVIAAGADGVAVISAILKGALRRNTSRLSQAIKQARRIHG